MKSHRSLVGLLALIFVPPLTDFSKDPDMADGDVAAWIAGPCDLQGDCWSCRRNWKTLGHSTEAIARAPLMGSCRFRSEGVRWTRVYTQWDLLEAHVLAVGRFFRHRALSPKFAWAVYLCTHDSVATMCSSGCGKKDDSCCVQRFRGSACWQS